MDDRALEEENLEYLAVRAEKEHGADYKRAKESLRKDWEKAKRNPKAYKQWREMVDNF